MPSVSTTLTSSTTTMPSSPNNQLKPQASSRNTRTTPKRAKTRIQLAMEKMQEEKKMKGKRKTKKYLTIHTKLLIIEKVEKGTCYEDIEHEFNVQKPFVSKIMSQKQQLKATAKHFVDAGMSDKVHCTKAMKFGKYWYNMTAPSTFVTQEEEEETNDTVTNKTIMEDLKKLNVDVSVADVNDWVHNDGPSHGFLTDEEIVEDIQNGTNILQNYGSESSSSTIVIDNDNQKSPPKSTKTSVFTVLLWINGAYLWFLSNEETTPEQVKQMEALWAYVLTRYHTENGDQTIESFATPKKNK